MFERQYCQLCQHSNWLSINELCSGGWLIDQQELIREELLFPISTCANCGHVQVTLPYTTDIFATLYFANNREPDMWCHSVKNDSPYHEMLDFIGEANLTSQTRVADFGCGAAVTLKILQEKYPSITYFGFDFNVSACVDKIIGIQCDINRLELIEPNLCGERFSLVISTHVLEHVLQPIQYLQQLGRFLANEGLMFIEVPDCGEQALNCALETTNLVHGQHIHYFTNDSLQQVAESAGFSLIKQSNIRTGEIPRLQMLFKKNDQAAGTVKIHHTATAAVKFRFERYNSTLQKMYLQIEELLETHHTVGLWGIGGDFYNLLRTYPSLQKALAEQRIDLFDYELSGHSYKHKRIKSSQELSSYTNPVLIVPVYAPTRQRMMHIATHYTCVLL